MLISHLFQGWNYRFLFSKTLNNSQTVRWDRYRATAEREKHFMELRFILTDMTTREWADASSTFNGFAIYFIYFEAKLETNIWSKEAKKHKEQKGICKRYNLHNEVAVAYAAPSFVLLSTYCRAEFNVWTSFTSTFESINKKILCPALLTLHQEIKSANELEYNSEFIGNSIIKSLVVFLLLLLRPDVALWLRCWRGN